jgi:tetratricopeptide (TPR) repeat protein
MQDENEKPAQDMSIGEKINEFVQKHRTPIFILAGLILLGLIAFIVTLSVMDMLNKKAVGAIEELGSRYETLRYSIDEDNSTADVEQLLAQLDAFAHKNSGYAGGKAWSIIAGIYRDKEDWAAAETAWLSSAKTAKKTYLVPVSFFNAGAAAEEQGKTEDAIEHYSNCLAAAADFPGAPRAQFAIGRLRESLGEKDAAVTAYRAVVSGWPYDRVWANLARSRIIALESETDSSGE